MENENKAKIPTSCLIIIIIVTLIFAFICGITIHDSLRRKRNEEAIYGPTTSYQKTVDYMSNLPENALRPANAENSGYFNGPSGVEYYYNVPMDSVLKLLYDAGYDEDEYAYWINDNGCKMFGEYIMCAADYNQYPFGTIVETSLGKGIICDTGSAFEKGVRDIDLATDWQY